MRKEDVTYLDKLTELRLDVDHPNNLGYLFILVEGDTDIRLYRKFFNLDCCKVEFIPGGNPKLEECVDELLKLSPLVIGIRDADFIHLSGRAYSNKNMFLTDHHDIEITLVKEDEIFSAVLCEYTDIPQSQYVNIKDMIFNSIEKISYLKWLNDIENLKFKFDIGFQDLMTLPNFEIAFEEYFRRLVSNSPNAAITDISTIESKIDTLRGMAPDRYQLSNGHDFMKALSKFIREQGKVSGISDDRITGIFRVAFRSDLLGKTLLYRDTKVWASSHGCDMYPAPA